jgi:hypothetical protein
MAVAYVSVSHSLQVGTDAGNRDRAAGYMQQQLEMVKLAEQTDSNLLNDYISNPNQPFCVNPTSNEKVDGACKICVNDSQTSTGFADDHGDCPGNRPPVTLSLVYNDSTKVITANASWDASNGIGQGKLQAYYKLPTASLAGACAAGQYYDVVITMDSSSSMTGPFPSDPTGPTTLEIEKNSAISLVTALNLASPGDRAGAIQFNSTTKVLSNVTTDLSALTSSIKSMSFNFGTNYIPALDASNSLLSASPSTNHKVLVFMSDGIANDDKATILKKTGDMQAAGIIIYTVGIGVDSDPAAQALLFAMKGGSDSRISGSYTNVTDKASFDKMAIDLADVISC